MENNIQSMQEFYAIFMRMMAEKNQWEFVVTDTQKGKGSRNGTETEK